jgi:hypothetical protein
MTRTTLFFFTAEDAEDGRLPKAFTKAPAVEVPSASSASSAVKKNSADLT